MILEHSNIWATTGKVNWVPIRAEQNEDPPSSANKTTFDFKSTHRTVHLHTTAPVSGVPITAVKGMSFTVNISDWWDLGSLFLWDKHYELLQIQASEIAIDQAAFVSRLIFLPVGSI